MLSNVQTAILEALAVSPLSKQFYWTGGTLLAEKYLHHRHSYDVDLFTDAPFQYEEVIALVHEVKEKTDVTVIEEQKVHGRWEFFLHNHRDVRFEFVHYDFPALHPRKRWRGVLIDSLDDLVANKTMAVVERHAPKDAVDIYFLMTKKKYTLDTLLARAKKKFGLTLDPSSLIGEILLACRDLHTIKTMLFGTARQQEQTLDSIHTYFKDLSADFLHRAWME